MTSELIDSRQPASEEPAGRPTRPWLALSAVLAGNFLHTFDMLVISIAAPSIREGTGASAAAAQWMFAGYTLAFALLLITFGRLGDAVGRRRMVLAGSIGFTVASLVCALAADPALLIAGRVAQGASAAAMTPQVLPVIMMLFPGAKRVSALGAHAGVIAVATVSGPLLGGILIHADVGGLGWRTIFLINLPVGLFTIAAVLRWLPRNDTVDTGRRARLDVGSVAMATIGLLMLIFPLVQGQDLGWPLWTFVVLVGSVPVLLWMLRRQRVRAENGQFALISLPLFTLRGFVGGALANFLVIGGVAAFFLVFVMYMQTGLGYDPAEIGLTMASWALATGVASVVTVPMARRIGRPMPVAGALLMAAGMAALLIVLLAQGSALSAGWVALCLTVVGVGMGMLSPPLYDLALTDVPRQDAGSASGMFGTLAQVGSALGVAVIGALFFGLVTAGGNPDRAELGPIVAEAGLTPAATAELERCLSTIPLTEGTADVVDRCAGVAPPSRERLAAALHRFSADVYTTAAMITLIFQVLCFSLAALLLWRLLPRRAGARGGV